ncbi:unnamed protein product [Paramecium primaurelia]|uniref:Tetratricopeptide repeat protein n=1 Tax=Paramecium primaurelia TaxID=5886 RepID=A0A8S1NY65_PARPR|nr:unnamed protein product [Paramecium primaurelia]
MSNKIQNQYDNFEAFEHYSKSQQFLIAFRMEEALFEIDNALNLDPKFAEAYTLRSEIYEKMNVYDKALEDVNFSISLKNNEAESYYQRGKNSILQLQQFIGENNYLTKHCKIV